MSVCFLIVYLEYDYFVWWKNSLLANNEMNCICFEQEKLGSEIQGLFVIQQLRALDTIQFIKKLKIWRNKIRFSN